MPRPLQGKGRQNFRWLRRSCQRIERTPTLCHDLNNMVWFAVVAHGTSWLRIRCQRVFCFRPAPFSGNCPSKCCAGQHMDTRAKNPGPGPAEFALGLRSSSGIGVDAVSIYVTFWSGFCEKDGCEGGHGCMVQSGRPPCGESSRNALLEDGWCLSGSSSCQAIDEGCRLLAPTALVFHCHCFHAAAVVVE